MTRRTWKLLDISHYYAAVPMKKIAQQAQVIAALEGVTFSQPYGEIVGIIGGTGAGKSTLGALLLDQLEPSKGVISGGEKGGCLALPTRRNEERTGEVYTRQRLTRWGISKKKIPYVMEQIHFFSELGIRFSQRLRTYTTEEKVKLEISLLLHVAPSVIVIDDALLTVKEDFYLKVLAFLVELKELGSSIWIETTRIKRLEGVFDKVVWLEFGRVQQHGEVTEVLTAYDAYYFNVHRLPVAQQQRFWKKGYQGQVVPPQSSVAEAKAEAKAKTEAEEKAETNEDRSHHPLSEPPSPLLDPLPSAVKQTEEEKAPQDVTVSPTKKAPVISRVSRHRPRSNRQRTWMIRCLSVLGLLALGLWLANLWPEKGVKRLTLLPTTQKKAPSVLPLTSKSESSSESVSHPESSSAAPETDLGGRADETYVVKAGESLSQLAERFQVTVTHLTEWNRLMTDQLHANQVLRVRAPEGTEAESSSQRLRYEVKEGDSLASIAQAYGVTVADLQAANQLVDTVIYAGTHLWLPSDGAGDTTARPSEGQEAQQNEQQHVVVPGDTLYSIASAHGVEILAIQQRNGLQTEQLSPGQVLYVP